MGDRGRPVSEIVEFIETVGAHRCTIASDYGWNSSFLPAPVPGTLEFLESLWQAGVAESDLALMASVNPGHLLQLSLS